MLGVLMTRGESHDMTTTTNMDNKRPFTGSEVTHINVILYLGSYDIASVLGVSWQWNRLISRNRLIWYHMYKQLSVFTMWFSSSYIFIRYHSFAETNFLWLINYL
jgi:hypothetical protein